MKLENLDFTIDHTEPSDAHSSLEAMRDIKNFLQTLSERHLHRFKAFKSGWEDRNIKIGIVSSKENQIAVWVKSSNEQKPYSHLERTIRLKLRLNTEPSGSNMSDFLQESLNLHRVVFTFANNTVGRDQRDQLQDIASKCGLDGLFEWKSVTGQTIQCVRMGKIIKDGITFRDLENIINFLDQTEPYLPCLDQADPKGRTPIEAGMRNFRLAIHESEKMAHEAKKLEAARTYVLENSELIENLKYEFESNSDELARFEKFLTKQGIETNCNVIRSENTESGNISFSFKLKNNKLVDYTLEDKAIVKLLLNAPKVMAKEAAKEAQEVKKLEAVQRYVSVHSEFVQGLKYEFEPGSAELARFEDFITKHNIDRSCNVRKNKELTKEGKVSFNCTVIAKGLTNYTLEDKTRVKQLLDAEKIMAKEAAKEAAKARKLEAEVALKDGEQVKLLSSGYSLEEDSS